ncbi:MAG: cobalamin-dependent protein [archaeon]
MTDLILWNSLATRRRSISDILRENGLCEIKTYLEKQGYSVNLIDWANPDFYDGLAPDYLTSLNRAMVSSLLNSLKNKNRGISFKIKGALNMILQDNINSIQKRRMNKMLDSLAEEIAEKKPLALGIKVWYGEAFVWSNMLVEKVKKLNQEIITIAGGYHPTIYEEDFLRYSNFDIAVTAQGEFTLSQILKIIKDNKGKSKQDIIEYIAEKAEKEQIKNLIYRKNREIIKTKRSLPSLKFKTFPDYPKDDGKVNIHVIIDSYGCDYGKCYFCVHSLIYPCYMARNPKDIVKEIKYMINKKGIGLYRFAGSDTPYQFGERIARELLNKKINIEYSMGCRAVKGSKKKDHYNKIVQSYKTLLNSGLKSIFMGGETGNDIINDKIMNKGINSEDIIYTIKAIRQAENETGKKIDISLALIYPCPLVSGITLQQVKQDDINLIKSTQPDGVMITPPGPFKNSNWYREKEKFGFEFEEDIIKKAMSYEYVLYKPPVLWPKIGYTLNKRPFSELLKDCSELRNEVESLGFPTDLSDEHFLMLRAAGFKGKEGVLKFKEESIRDVASANYKWSNDICRRVNDYSSMLASSNY